jgi:hypothetical protein
MLKKMRSRLHSVLTLLLAFLVLGAGTQSAVCELACNLGGKIPCHGAATVSAQSSSGDEAMAGMPAMHCSGMKSAHASKVAAPSIRAEGRDGGRCTHLASPATLNSISRSETVKAVQWVVVGPLPSQVPVAAHRIAASSNAPPLLPPVNLLLVTLRV